MSTENKSKIVPANLIGQKNKEGESQTHPGDQEGYFYMTTRDRRGPNIGSILRPGLYTVIALQSKMMPLMVNGFALNHLSALHKAQRLGRRNSTPTKR